MTSWTAAARVPNSSATYLLFAGCWRISTNWRTRTNWPSSPGRAECLPSASAKPSRRCWSWGDWLCRCCWRRAAGKSTPGPGCTGRCSAGSGSTSPPNASAGGGGRVGPQRRDAHRTRKKTRCHFFPPHPIDAKPVLDSEQHGTRVSVLHPTRLASSLEALSPKVNRDQAISSALCATYSLTQFGFNALNNRRIRGC